MKIEVANDPERLTCVALYSRETYTPARFVGIQTASSHLTSIAAEQSSTRLGAALFWLNLHEVIQSRESRGCVQNGQVWVQAGASILNRVQFERDKSIKQTRKGFLKTFEQLYLFQKNKLLL